MVYIYLGDKNTHTLLKSQLCKAVKRRDGKCKRGKNGSMLVEFQNGEQHVIIGRLLRKVIK